MNWFQSIVVALVTGALGLLCGGTVMNACVRWYRVSSFEGASGYAVVFAALISGVVALVLGLIVARIVAAGASPGFLKGLGWACGCTLAITGVVALVARLLAHIPPTLDDRELMLEVEFKLPVSVAEKPVEEAGKSYLWLGSAVGGGRGKSVNGTLRLADARLEDRRWVVPGEVFVFTARGRRLLDVKIGDFEPAGFIIPLPGHPGREQLEWSEWMPRPRAGSPPWPDTKTSYRFRIRPIVPEGETGATEREPTQEERQQAAFEALDPEAPIEAWLPFTRYGQTEERIRAAVENITRKEGYVAILGELMQAEDQRLACDAMYVVEHIPEPPPDLVPVVTEAGRGIAAMIRVVNETPVDADPGYEKPAEVSLRFGAWMVAVRALRKERGADFTPELGVILELSRVRGDSHVMRQSVLRVASFYMHEWTGLEPLPGDPPPR